MGNVSGRLEDGATLYLRDQTRLSIASIEVTNARDRVLLRITPNAYPCTKVIAKKEPGDDSLVEFVQDPDPGSPTPLLLRLSNDDELYLKFTFTMRRREEAAGTAPPVDMNINGLTFITASNARDLENLVTREFHADPNLHKNPNVFLLGDRSTEGSPSVQFDYKWRWRPPRGGEERGGGWRNTCSFVEYDQRAHKLSTLVQFSFWVQGRGAFQKSLNETFNDWFPLDYSHWTSPILSPDGGKLNMPQKLRLASIGGRSPIPTENSNDQGDTDPSSPIIDDFDGSTIAPSTTNVPQVKVDNFPRPPVDNTLGDDGPLFRATMKSLEQKTSSLRQKMKKVLKRAEQARLAQQNCNEGMQAFMESLRDASTTGTASGIQPALEHYFDKIFKELLVYGKQQETYLRELIIEPLTKLYVSDLKQAESKKRDFEEESRDYYSYVSRYLGIRNDSSKDKKKAESESKYQTKRKNFELKRFDYSSFMQDLHGGRKEQEVLSHLTMFADAQTRGFLNTAEKVRSYLPELQALDHEVKEAAKEFLIQRTEREERRRNLEKNNTAYIEPESVPSFVPPATPNSTMQSSSEILGHHIGFERLGPGTSTIRVTSSGSDCAMDNDYLRPSGLGLISASVPANTNLGSQITEKESERRKEGLLWALSRPGSHADPKGLNKQAWHKYWVVLAGGQLCEYTNWKQKLGLHNDPINLRMASVREARNADRRFCFEVVTPHYKRVYQATSEEDMNNWIMAINNAVKSTIESGASVRNFDPSKMMDTHEEAPQLKNISSALTGKGPHHHTIHPPIPVGTSGGHSSSINVSRRTTVGARPAASTRDSCNFADNPEKLLQMIREADASNSFCADCGSQVKAEWTSINLGIILCIECSGLHRSLGTHISKVRSLTLDVTSFTPDLIDLLCSLSNRRANTIWESKVLADQKPSSQASREARLKYITEKYDRRIYVPPLPMVYANPNEMLVEAAKSSDIPLALHALALRADPSFVDPETGKPVLLLALESASTSSLSQTSSRPDTADEMSISPLQSIPPPSTFPLAELLLQNGCEIPQGMQTDLLSPGARNYLAVKEAKRKSMLATPGLVKNASVSSHGSKGREGREFSGIEGGKAVEGKSRERSLQKRISGGARLHKASVGERYS